MISESQGHSHQLHLFPATKAKRHSKSTTKQTQTTHTKERCERGRLFNSKKEYAKYCKIMQNMEGSLSRLCPQHLLSIVIGVGGKRLQFQIQSGGLDITIALRGGNLNKIL
jgi:hypothetical protein